jgi:FkbM family methyltransferase
VTIHVSTIDKICPELKLARIDILKMDVHGSELEVLRGVKRMLLKGEVRQI